MIRHFDILRKYQSYARMLLHQITAIRLFRQYLSALIVVDELSANVNIIFFLNSNLDIPIGIAMLHPRVSQKIF